MDSITVVAIGNAANDAELRTTRSGKEVANFSLAFSSAWRKKEGTQEPATNYLRCFAWDEVARYCARNVKRGDRLHVEGTIETRPAQGGKGPWSTELHLRRVVHACPKREG